MLTYALVCSMIPYALLAFMAILQTFIFMVLSYVYLAGAVSRPALSYLNH